MKESARPSGVVARETRKVCEERGSPATDKDFDGLGRDHQQRLSNQMSSAAPCFLRFAKRSWVGYAKARQCSRLRPQFG